MNPDPKEYPAFPGGTWLDRGRPHNGMTLRDYFAAKAMNAHLINDSGGILATAEARNMKASTVVARVAYELADAMIAERSK